MKSMYFRTICFAWAFIGILTRILMVTWGEKWNKWEMNNAYTEKKPLWIYFVSIVGVLFIGFTWYMVYTTHVKYSWIIAIFLSFTLIKISLFIFNYDEFRRFAYNVLNNPRKRLGLNIGVFGISIVFIIMGFLLY